jgi:hypothetical protein
MFVTTVYALMLQICTGPGTGSELCTMHVIDAFPKRQMCQAAATPVADIVTAHRDASVQGSPAGRW